MKTTRWLILFGALLVSCSDTSGAGDQGTSDAVFDLPFEADRAVDAPGDVEIDTDVGADDADATAIDVALDPGGADASDGIDSADDVVADAPQDADIEVSDDASSGDLPLDAADLADATDVVSCSDAGDCGFGFRCEVDRCVALECHLGDYAEGIADKPCPVGQICEVLLGTADAFNCVAFERSCGFASDCPFGFRCEGGACALSECTVGNMDSGYGPRLCSQEGEICACMEDGSEINGGRGACVTDPGECP